MQLERQTPSQANYAPLYLQLAKQLRHKIDIGEIGTGDALPSERELCATLGASRVTVRKALDTLISDGILTRKQGSGTYVAPRIEAPGSYLTSFSDDAQGRGDTPTFITIRQMDDMPTAEEARLLEMSVDGKIVRWSRIRLINQEPLAVEHATIPMEVIRGMHSLRASLYETLNYYGSGPVTGSQRIRAALANADEAAWLSIPEQSEVLRIERVSRRADGRAVEFTRSSYRGDRFDFVSELRGLDRDD